MIINQGQACQSNFRKSRIMSIRVLERLWRARLITCGGVSSTSQIGTRRRIREGRRIVRIVDRRTMRRRAQRLRRGVVVVFRLLLVRCCSSARINEDWIWVLSNTVTRILAALGADEKPGNHACDDSNAADTTYDTSHYSSGVALVRRGRGAATAVITT